MCNDYRLMVDVASIVEDFAHLKIKIRFGEGAPNVAAREDIKITDMAPIIRRIGGTRDEADLVQRRWNWPGQNKRPVYNFRSDGREFNSNRCLIVADGFYEFTDPTEKGKKRKDKWLFTRKDEPIFCIAGIWRDTPDVGEAFTMLTMDPGPDIAPYHDRQIVILERDAWADWLDPAVSAKSLIRRCPPAVCMWSRLADAILLSLQPRLPEWTCHRRGRWHERTSMPGRVCRRMTVISAWRREKETHCSRYPRLANS